MNTSLIYNDTTATGKSGKTLFWSGAAFIILAALTAITGNPTFFIWHSGILVVVANVLIVLIKNLLDSSTPNFTPPASSLTPNV